MKQKIIKIIKKIFKVKSKEQLVARYRLRINKRLYSKKISVEGLIEHLTTLGIQKGSNVFIHSSWGEFYNYEGSINDFIDSIINLIGDKGTLAMPAYPLLRNEKSIFNVSSTPTRAGLVAETFRNYPGVKRSCHVRHSVCAFGSQSDFLLNEHHLSETSWDEKSPYFKLSKINAQILSFGLGKTFVGTSLHCAESILREEYPYFAAMFGKKEYFRYKDCYGNMLEHTDLSGEGGIREFTNLHQKKIVKKYFDKLKYKKTRISNLTVNVYEADYAINKAIELARKGIVFFTKPDPKKYFK
jgi:aminoglycoside 3-N-acetyltransferase